MATPISSRSYSSLSVPQQGAGAAALGRFLTEFFDYQSTYRAQHMREWGLAKNFYESMQWVRLDTRATGGDPRRAVRWTQHNPADDIPKPVQNEIIGIIDNEVSKLGRRQSKPYARSLSIDTGVRGGATLANDVLNWHLDVIGWPTLRRRGIFKNVLYGTGIWKSYWKTDFRDAVRIGSSEAVRCIAGCNFRLSSASIPASPKFKIPGGALVTPDDAAPEFGMESYSNPGSTPSFTAQGCFECGAPLVKGGLLPHEIEGGDFFGRPLGQAMAKGDADIEVVSPFDYFVDNEGLDVESGGTDSAGPQWFGQCTPRSLDWIGNNFDVEVKEDGYYKDGEQIKPEDPVAIAEYHPLLGEHGYWSGGPRSALDRTVYRYHSRVKEFYCAPTRQYPLGRMIVAAGNIILADDTLMQPSRLKQDTHYPRVKYCAARFWPRDGEFFAQGICVPLFSPQMRINMTYSQIVSNREKNGGHAVQLTKGMRLHSPGWAKNYPGTVVVWEPDPENPTLEPRNIPAQLLDVNVYQEADRTREHMQQVAGAQDVDIGKAPRNVSAATAIQLLQERASERRDYREQDLRECFKAVYSHHLLLLAEKVVEERDYLAPGKGKTWEVKQFIGQALKGFTEIMVDEEAGYDLRAFEREGLIQAYNMGIVTFSTALKRREALKALGLSGQYTDEDNVQVDDAERKWFDFRDHQKVPVIDPTEDAHNIHWQVYGKFLKSDDGLTLKEAAQWETLLPLIAGWEMNLQAARAMDMTIRQAMGSGLPLVLPAGPDGMPMQPEAMMLPGAYEEQILTIWGRMLQAKGQSPELILGDTPQGLFARFKAVAEAHRLYALEGKGAEMAGQPTVAAPGVGADAGAQPASVGPQQGPVPPQQQPEQGAAE